jgi:phosphonoacetaldehyde hydrolase
VIFDWAGTTVDYGSRAPVAAFVEAFWRRGIEITTAQARGPMGAAKRDHVRALFELDDVAGQWASVHDRSPSEDDVDAVYREFMPLQVESAASSAGLIPGTLETMGVLRKRGIRVGSSSGYNREIMDEILPVAREQGYEPDSLVCPEDVPAGRPHPWMMYRCATELEVYPMSACVKVGDTIPDIEEGLNAGAWSVGLAKSGNELGLKETEADALDPRDLSASLEAIYDRMYRAGAHYVVDTIAELPTALDSIEARLGRGERP